ncbi:hypothetical protein HDU98_003760, partial [Podochytrium sp. JEL0797]
TFESNNATVAKHSQQCKASRKKLTPKRCSRRSSSSLLVTGILWRMRNSGSVSSCKETRGPRCCRFCVSRILARRIRLRCTDS